jgi:DNA polymerase elongation subunit (family B)
MEFTYTKIDLNTASREEIQAEINRMQKLSYEWHNEEQAIKLTINSVYGALGNKWLAYFNPAVAETVTLQGQDLIKFAEKVMNAYFNKFWHLDKELHDKLGLTEVREVRQPVNVYSDTDSCYICFEEVARSCDWEGKYESPKDLILAINENRINEYLRKQFDKYAEKWGTQNYQDFELETIAESGIWLAKKKYILNKRWEDGIHIDTLTEIMYKGIELAQSSTPQFARVKLDYLMKYILEKKKSLDKRELTLILRKIKEEFRIADPNDVSLGRSVNDYQKYIRNDSSNFEIADKTPIHVRAAGYHNYLLNQNPEMKRKYEMLRGGNKIKFYYVDVKSDKENNVFAYSPGNYPYEFAPSIDYDMMFEKTILDPINRVTVALGLGSIPPALHVVTSVMDF